MPGRSRLRAGARVWARVVRSEPVATTGLLAVALVAAVLVTTGTRLLDQVSDEDLAVAVATADPRAANIQFLADDRLPAGPDDDPLAPIAAEGQRLFDAEMPPAVQDTITAQEFVVESPPFSVSSFPDQDPGPFIRTLRFRFQSDLDGETAVVEGQPPGRRSTRPLLVGPECPADITDVEAFEAAQAATATADPAAEEPADGDDPDDDRGAGHDHPDGEAACAVTDVPVYEISLTARTAEDLLVELGDTVVLRPAADHPRWAFIPTGVLDRLLLAEVTAIVELSDPVDGYWFGDDSLHRPRIIESPDFRFIQARATTDVADFGPMLRDVPGVHFDFAWRFDVDDDRIDQTTAADLAADIDKLGTGQTEVVTLLPEIISQHLVERALTVGLLSSAYAGLLAVSAAAAFVLASLAASRHRESMRLLLDRGAGRGGLRVAGLWHGAAVSVPAGVVAVAVAALLVDEGRWSRALAAGGAVLVATIGGVTAAVWRAADRAAAGTITGPRSAARSDPFADPGVTDSRLAAARSAVRDGAVVTLAIVTVVLVRRRVELGLVGASPTDVAGAPSPRGAGSLSALARSGADVDWLMALTPPLVGLACGLVIVRILRPLVEAAASLARHRRGPVPFVGLRRLVAQGPATRSAVVIVVVAVGLAGFASGVRAAVAAAQNANGWHEVGADIALRAEEVEGALPAAVVAEIEATGTVAAGFESPATGVITPPDALPLDLLAVDVERYRAVLAESPVGLEPVASLTASSSVAADEPLPAVASGGWLSGERPGVGDRYDVQLGIVRVPLEIVATAAMPTATGDLPLVVIDLEALRARYPSVAAPTTVAFVDTADAASASALVDRVDEIDRSVVSADRFAHRAALLADPFLRWTDRGLRVLAGLSLALAVLVVVATSAIAAPARQCDLGLLTTMGLDSRQAAGVTAIEQLVPVAAAAAGGAAVAGGLLWLLEPALGLSAFSGGSLPVDVDLWSADRGPLVALVLPAIAVGGGAIVTVVASTWHLVGRRRGRVRPPTLSMGEV